MKYPKIQSVFERDANTHKFTGTYAEPQFEYLAEADWIWREKLDGTNIRIYWQPAGREIRGRSNAASLHPDLIAAIEETVSEDKLQKTFGEKQVTLYGEGIGPKIQQTELTLFGHKFVLFDVMVRDRWLDAAAIRGLGMSMNILSAPIVGSGTLSAAREIVRRGFKSGLPGAQEGAAAEGLVLLPVVDLYMPDGSRIITKLKTRDYA